MKILIFCLLAFLNVLVEGVLLVCDFKTTARGGYGCEVNHLGIESKCDRTITDVLGSHQFNKTNDDVVHFYSMEHTIQYFPLGLTKHFKNLNSVFITKSYMLEIHADDFKQFGSTLKEITIKNSYIENLEAGLFASTPNLKLINFNKNQIATVDKGVFTNLKQLKKLWFCYNVCYSGYTKNDVKYLSEEIEENCKESSEEYDQKSSSEEVQKNSSKILQRFKIYY